MKIPDPTELTFWYYCSTSVSFQPLGVSNSRLREVSPRCGLDIRRLNRITVSELEWIFRILYQDPLFTNGDIKAKRIYMLCMLCLKFTLSRCRPESRLPVQHLGHSTIITLYPASSLSPPAGLPTHPYFLFSWVGLRGKFKIPETLLLDDRMWNA